MESLIRDTNRDSRRIIFSFSLCLMLAFSSNAQFFYKKGTIIKNEGDPIKCMVKLERSYTNYIYYKKDLLSQEDSVLLEVVKAIITKDQYFQKIKLRDSLKVVMLSIPGKDSLFFYQTVRRGEIRAFSSTTTYQGSDMVNHYLLKKGSEIITFEENDFKEKLISLVKDCSHSLARLNDPNCRYEEIPSIIEEYYRCI